MNYSIPLLQLQVEVADWSNKNFPDNKPYHPLLGVMEEVGELTHAHLKQEQGIRTNENHIANKEDAIGDIIIYLADYCSRNNIDMDGAVQSTWNKVKQRDWQKDTKKGGQ